jgi:hypothetical protein
VGKGHARFKNTAIVVATRTKFSKPWPPSMSQNVVTFRILFGRKGIQQPKA